MKEFPTVLFGAVHFLWENIAVKEWDRLRNLG